MPEALYLWNSLKDKTAEGESLRLIDFDLFESKHVFQRIACCFLHLGLNKERFKEVVLKITSTYFKLVRFAFALQFCPVVEKIKFFAREVVEQLMKIPEIRDFSRRTIPLQPSRGLMEEQILLYSAYSLFIPLNMRNVIESNNFAVDVIGIEPEVIASWDKE